MGQSTNDVFLTAGKLTSIFLVNNLIEELLILQESLYDKSIEFNYVIKLGKTHLQDTVRIRMGQQFHDFATSIVRDIRRVKLIIPDLNWLILMPRRLVQESIPIGGIKKYVFVF